jgi:integrase
VSKSKPISLVAGLDALFAQTEQRISDGVRSRATLEMQQAHGRWLCAQLGPRRTLQAIDEETLEYLTAPRVPPRTFGANTLRKRMSTLRAVLGLAHRRRWIARMPAFPQVLAPWRPRQRYLHSYLDAVRLFRALPRHRAEWMWLCLWTGQHASDVERMIWTDVELGGRGREPSMLIRNTKNRKTAVRVRMPRPLARVLRAKWKRERPRADAAIVQPWASRKSTLPLACYRLGLQPLNAIDLRHSLFTWAIRRLGITPGVVAWAGHSSPAMMARAYAHALPPGLKEVTDELDAFAEGADVALELIEHPPRRRMPPRKKVPVARSSKGGATGRRAS